MPVMLAVGLGGALGALLRFQMVLALKRADTLFPWGTLLVNVLGSFLIGALWAWFLSRPDTPEWLRVGLMTGLLGGYTTLSAVSLETTLLLEAGAYGPALANVAGNFGLGLLACFGGLMLMRSILAT